MLRMDEVIIIGAGPAGLAAALQLQRHGIVPRVFEASRPGGLLWNANWVQNYPGFPAGISGPDLVAAFLAHARKVEITPETVLELTWEGQAFRARTASRSYRAKVAVIASGTVARPLTCPVIPADACGRVFYEIVDLLELTHQQILIVGSGDAAFDYALNFAKRENRVTILNRGSQVKCLPLLWRQAQASEAITYLPGTTIDHLALHPDGWLDVDCTGPQGGLEIRTDYLVGATGRLPALEFISASVIDGQTELTERGLLHFAGDVKNGIFRQTAVATGDGILVGMRINQILKENV
jgi:thioredoxin reductase (NADPH)